jgi:probable aminopeptidase NPEPL1
VNELRFARTAAAAVRGANQVLLLAPEGRLRKGWLQRAVHAPWTHLLARAAREDGAGARGTLVVAQNPDAGPQRVMLGILPDASARSNCPARSLLADELIAKAELGEGTSAVIALAEKPGHVLPLARALARAWPEYTRSSKTRKATARFLALAPDGAPRVLDRAGRAVVTRSRWAARLVDMPTAELDTAGFVRETRKAARGLPHLTVSVLGTAEVLARGLGGLHAVGRAALQGPRLLLLRYKPPKARRVAGLVGKGIVYDTGGLSIKPTAGMYGMKMDMGGAAAVVGATLALAEGGHRDAIVCAAALAENAVGPDSYRPNDVLDMHSGHTVEINNTDAEGRLVVADGLSYVARTYRPDLLLDMATLTGAQCVATGKRHAGIVSNRAGLEAAACEAGRRCGDLVHPLPFAPELYQMEFASKVADMRNSVANRMNAQVSCAGQFLYSHVDDLDLPWLHVDMAGPAERAERATGYGVALAATLLRSLDAQALDDR